MGGITVWVEGYEGDQLTVPRLIDRGDDARHWVSTLLKSTDDTFACLRFVDPYGRTVFNQAQLRVLITELERLRGTATSRQNAELLEIAALANFALALPHRFLVFLGD